MAENNAQIEHMVRSMTAIISPCGKYRYRLDRSVADSGPVYAFFGVNPSTADASIDDATVRKWRGFISRWGGSRFIVGNEVFRHRPGFLIPHRDQCTVVRHD